MRDRLRRELARRPWWMNALLAFCAWMALVSVPRDLLTTAAGSEEEVWFGVLFRGEAAKLLALLHWLVYAAGTVGFWRMSAWMWPWAALYAGQVAISAALWPLLYRSSARGFVLGAAFAFVALQLWRSRERFGAGRSTTKEET
jgi:hypothetical protein